MVFVLVKIKKFNGIYFKNTLIFTNTQVWVRVEKFGIFFKIYQLCYSIRYLNRKNSLIK